ncbi:uncharacterized protein LOC116853228 [Odontomachus brunneus]|uniref:uncharacterized protein LOC116853228 n=1 Tax=Odontomachus brunneus TaxID=486640 RepID=UPI0013F1D20E|nr:uncharacterized protein LOC116853228 [Odontomachus brunneus]
MTSWYLFVEEDLKADSYINVLETVVKSWIDEIAVGKEYMFEQDSAPAHKAKKTQAWLYNNLPYRWSPDLWPPSNSDCNPLVLLRMRRDRGKGQCKTSQHQRCSEVRHHEGDDTFGQERS